MSWKIKTRVCYSFVFFFFCFFQEINFQYRLFVFAGFLRINAWRKMCVVKVSLWLARYGCSFCKTNRLLKLAAETIKREIFAESHLTGVQRDSIIGREGYLNGPTETRKFIIDFSILSNIKSIKENIQHKEELSDWLLGNTFTRRGLNIAYPLSSLLEGKSVLFFSFLSNLIDLSLNLKCETIMRLCKSVFNFVILLNYFFSKFCFLNVQTASEFSPPPSSFGHSSILVYDSKSILKTFRTLEDTTR